MQETYLNVNLNTIRQNIINIKKINKEEMFCAVVKANAYGLGCVEISQNIEDLVDYFAVARASEAYILRKNNIKKPILILGYVSLEDIKRCSQEDIDITIYDLDYAKKINDLSIVINCHIAIDTGQGRLGFRDFEVEKIKELSTLKNLNVIAAFSHFSSADENDISVTIKQNELFDSIIEQISDSFDFKFVHIANSSGALKHKIFKNMIRIGIAMYGIYPSDIVKRDSYAKISKAFSFYTKVSFVKDIDKGTSISYGRTFISDNKMRVATVTIGYADGYFREFSNKGHVYINNKSCRVLGRVCMDQIIVDVTDTNCKIGDIVEVYKNIYEDAIVANTIPYELMTSIGARVLRRYFLDGKEISSVDYLGDLYES